MEEKKTSETNTWGIFDKIVIKEAEGEKKLFVHGKQYMSWPIEDQISQRIAIVQLYKTGIAEQEELSKIFSVHIKTVYNYITAFEIGGISSLVGETKGPKESWKLNPETRFQILEIIFNNREISYEKTSEILLRRWKR
jgi:hypothetical protein